MSKFKAGDKVFSIQHGVITLESCELVALGTVAYTDEEGEKHLFWNTGKAVVQHVAPSLYTLEEARRMGFPVPAEPVVFEVVVGDGRLTGAVGCEHADDLNGRFYGKRVRVTVEVAE